MALSNTVFFNAMQDDSNAQFTMGSVSITAPHRSSAILKLLLPITFFSQLNLHKWTISTLSTFIYRFYTVTSRKSVSIAWHYPTRFFNDFKSFITLKLLIFSPMFVGTFFHVPASTLRGSLFLFFSLFERSEKDPQSVQRVLQHFYINKFRSGSLVSFE